MLEQQGLATLEAKHIPRPPSTAPSTSTARAALAGSTWITAHEALSRLAKTRASADAEEGRWLLAAWRCVAHVHLGFANFNEYVERLFGYKPRSTQEKLRVAEALENLPALARALQQGALNWSAIRELTRVAVPETEQQWFDVAHNKTLRQLEDLIAHKHLGDTPADPPDAAARRHILRFEVHAETFALFREALSQLRRQSHVPLDDDATLLELARLALAGPTDRGRASYQIALDVCTTCERAHQQAGGTRIAVEPEVLAMARCDAQHIAITNMTTPANDAASTQAPAFAPAASAAPAPLDADHRAHVGATPLGNTRTSTTPPRAKQTIPPATRRAVLLRDHHRCRVPGCRNGSFLDSHHLELRSEGGTHHIDNLLSICGAHHRALHRNELIIEGYLSTGLRFRHADGSEYGQPVQPRTLDAHTKTFAALRHLGFREGPVRAVCAELRQRRELSDATPERLLREALARLTGPGVGRR